MRVGARGSSCVPCSRESALGCRRAFGPKGLTCAVIDCKRRTAFRVRSYLDGLPLGLLLYVSMLMEGVHGAGEEALVSTRAHEGGGLSVNRAGFSFVSAFGVSVCCTSSFVYVLSVSV